MARSKSIIVTVTDAALDNIQTIAHQLTAKGMNVDQVLPITGVISGSCPEGKEAALRAVGGVQSVEEEAQVQIPSPESDVH
jgi:hypothetical protein